MIKIFTKKKKKKKKLFTYALENGHLETPGASSFAAVHHVSEGENDLEDFEELLAVSDGRASLCERLHFGDG